VDREKLGVDRVGMANKERLVLTGGGEWWQIWCEKKFCSSLEFQRQALSPFQPDSNATEKTTHPTLFIPTSSSSHLNLPTSPFHYCVTFYAIGDVAGAA
jgi:hypothetical protein